MSAPTDLLHSAIEALETVQSSDNLQFFSGNAGTSGHESAETSHDAAPFNGPPLTDFQSQLVDSFMHSRVNEAIFLPTGSGETYVVDAIVKRMLQKYPNKHIVICVVRPAQALSHAERLRTVLNVPVGAFCGGDFLYNFQEEFKRNSVLVFTAGLLMRLTKLNTYNLISASLLVLHDAFSAVRNHPMNTLIREYYWKCPGTEQGAKKPRILGVVLPQLQQLQRPFDKLRQLVRKLTHSAQASVLVPTGPALESLTARVHRAHIAMHAYAVSEEEQSLGKALQTHSLLVWDTLHAFGQNHFGRLIHFPPSPITTSGNGTHAPQSTMTDSVSIAPPNAAPYAFDPIHHDWSQIELMVEQSIACSKALPAQKADGIDHMRSDVAILVMKHVLRCAQAIQIYLELGAGPCLALMLPALKELLKLIEKTNLEELETTGNPVDAQLLDKIKQIVPASPFLQWLAHHRDHLVELSQKFGSRINGLIDILEEIIRHRESKGSLIENLETRRKNCLVTVVVGSEKSMPRVREAIQGVVKCSAFRWSGGHDDNVMNSTDSYLTIALMTAAEAGTGTGRKFIQKSDEAVWFSATDVVHAAGFDFESTALNVFFRESAVGAGSDAISGPECHVLATHDQTAAWLEICRADQLLLAAMQMIQAGDASFEEYLAKLTAGAAGSWADLNLPFSPASILHTLCLGLCGRPPHFSLSLVTPKNRETDRDGRKHLAVVLLPEELLTPDTCTLSVAFGSDDITFQGLPEDSDSEARDSAAEAALSALLACGLVAAYWQTRTLVVKSQQLAAMAMEGMVMPTAAMLMGSMTNERDVGNDTIISQVRHLVVSGPDAGSLPPSPFVDSSSSSAVAAGNRNDSPLLTETAMYANANDVRAVVGRLICPICGIVTTSEGHLKEHLAGRRHLKNLERLRQQQRGSSLSSFASAASVGKVISEKATSSNVTSGLQVIVDETGTPMPHSSSLAPPSSTAPQIASLSTIERLPSTLSDVFIRRSSSLHRNPSGKVYEGFPCVRVGDVVLPSSMDLRAFLEEMQQTGELDKLPSSVSQEQILPAIEGKGRIGGTTRGVGPKTSPVRKQSSSGPLMRASSPPEKQYGIPKSSFDHGKSSEMRVTSDDDDDDDDDGNGKHSRMTPGKPPRPSSATRLGSASSLPLPLPLVQQHHQQGASSLQRTNSTGSNSANGSGTWYRSRHYPIAVPFRPSYTELHSPLGTGGVMAARNESVMDMHHHSQLHSAMLQPYTIHQSIAPYPSIIHQPVAFISPLPQSLYQMQPSGLHPLPSPPPSSAPHPQFNHPQYHFGQVIHHQQQQHPSQQLYDHHSSNSASGAGRRQHHQQRDRRGPSTFNRRHHSSSSLSS